MSFDVAESLALDMILSGEPESGLAREWPEIIPLPKRGELDFQDDYPLSILPSVLQVAAAEAARFHKVPLASPAIAGLSVLAAAIAGKAIVVERPGLEHHPSLFFAMIAPSGERKSSPFKEMCYPLRRYYEDNLSIYDDLLLKKKAMDVAIDLKIAALKADGRKNNWSPEQIAQGIEEYEKKRFPAPVSPMLYTTDCTEQRLVQIMADRGGSFAVLSGEGRPIIDSILGKYSGNGFTGDSVYLAAISGDTITRDRIGTDGVREERIIHHPCLTVCFMVQNDKFLEMATHPSLRSSGTLARIWPVWLQSKVGYRLEDENDYGLDTAKLEPFNRTVFELLSRKNRDAKGLIAPHRATLSSDAAELRREFHNEIEISQREGGPLDDVRAIASKAVSQTCKMALILHIVSGPSVLDEKQSVISIETWSAAQTLGRYHLREAARSQRLADEDPLLESARKLLAWIRKERLKTVTPRLIARRGPRPRLKAADIDKTLALLKDHGYLVGEMEPGLRKPVYWVNPAVLSPMSPMSPMSPAYRLERKIL
jgi:hypothetical protein